MYDFFITPFDAGYMRRALIELLLLGILGGIVGVHVLLRKVAFITEVVQHTVFPGIAIAFALNQSLLAGALCTGLVSIVALSISGEHRRLRPDAVMAVLIATFFAAGVIVVSRQGGYQANLSSLLFGRILAVDAGEIRDTVIITTICITTLIALHKELVLRAFDPLTVRALGFRIARLDLVLNILITLTIVAAVRAVGTVLVVAFLVTPAATARLLSRRIGPMMAIASALAVVCGWLGLLVSYHGSIDHGWRLASGATVVLLFTVAFVIVWIVTNVRRRLAANRPAPDVGSDRLTPAGSAI